VANLDFSSKVGVDLTTLDKRFARVMKFGVRDTSKKKFFTRLSG